MTVKYLAGQSHVLAHAQTGGPMPFSKATWPVSFLQTVEETLKVQICKDLKDYSEILLQKY